MRPANLFLAFMLFFGALAVAETAQNIIDQVQVNLQKAPWEATVVGRVEMPGGSQQTAEFMLFVRPGGRQIERIEFKRPASLEGNFVVITDREVWNYLYLTNQLVIQPRAGAKVSGLGVNLTQLGDFSALTDKMVLKLAGTGKTPEGPAWLIQGTAKDPGNLGFKRIEIVILQKGPRPLTIRVLSTSGKSLASLNWRAFKRVSLSAQDLEAYPLDAQVIHKN